MHVARSIPSVRGWTSGHHSISPSSVYFSHCSSHLLILHRGSIFGEGEDDVPWCGDAVMAGLLSASIFHFVKRCWWKGWSTTSSVWKSREATTTLSPQYEALRATCTVDLTEGVHGHLAFLKAHSALAEPMVHVGKCSCSPL